MGADLSRAQPLTNNSELWVQQQKLPNPLGSSFGCQLSLSADGETLLVGDGFPFVFVKKSSGWAMQQALTPQELSDDVSGLGCNATLSADGNTALVGAFLSSDSERHGSVYAFTRTDDVWTQQQRLEPDDNKDIYSFGSALSLSADGSTALIGAMIDDFPSKGSGDAFIFTQTAGVWTQQQKLTTLDPLDITSEFGTAVALSADGCVHQDAQRLGAGAALGDTGG